MQTYCMFHTYIASITWMDPEGFRQNKPLSYMLAPLLQASGRITRLILDCFPDCMLPSSDYTIQIKICAEYRDMLPRPRLVCQEPGLRPIGLSPGVPDKSSRGLGSMSRYSAQILICFIAYTFLFFHSSVGLVGNFAGLPVCTVPSAIFHCNQNEAGHKTIKAPSMPCWGQLAHQNTLWHLSHSLVKMTDKMDGICINREVFSTRIKWMERL